MASDKRPTNEHILKQLETISRQMDQLFDAQKQLASDVKRIAK